MWTNIYVWNAVIQYTQLVLFLKPRMVVDLFACWQGTYGHSESCKIWKSILLCLMWLICRESNSQTCEGVKLTLISLTFLFFRPFYVCMSVLGSLLFHFSRIWWSFKFSDCKSFGVASVYSCLLEHSPLNNKMIIYISKKIILEAIMHLMVCTMLNGYYEDLAWGLFS